MPHWKAARPLEVRARHAGPRRAAGARARRPGGGRLEDFFLRLLRAGARRRPRRLGRRHADRRGRASARLRARDGARRLRSGGLRSWSRRTRSAATTRSMRRSRAGTSRAARRGSRRCEELLAAARRRESRSPAPRRRRVGGLRGRACAAARCCRPALARPVAGRSAQAPLLAPGRPARRRRPSGWPGRSRPSVGKPVTQGEGEVRRAATLVRNAASMPSSGTQACGPESRFRRVPLGVVAVVTPWNNPIAIPWGKIGPALALGNAVVWKPAPPATRLALLTLALAQEAGLPDGLARSGRPETTARAAALMSDPGVDAVSLSGSSLGGLGGAGDLRAPAHPAPGGARRKQRRDRVGGRGPAARGRARRPRRVRVRGAALHGQPPRDRRRGPLRRVPRAAGRRDGGAAPGAIRSTRRRRSGPLVSGAARDRVAGLVARGGADRRAHPHAACRGARAAPAPTIRRRSSSSRRTTAEIVQEESFGPVLCVERARRLRGGARPRQRRAAGARGGPLRGAGPLARAVRGGGPRPGSSSGTPRPPTRTRSRRSAAGSPRGVGPPEHGPGNLEFYTRLQAIYGGA